MRMPIFVTSITIAAVLLSVVSSAQAQGIDRIKRRSGIDSGKITKVTSLAVTISRGGVENHEHQFFWRAQGASIRSARRRRGSPCRCLRVAQATFSRKAETQRSQTRARFSTRLLHGKDGSCRARKSGICHGRSPQVFNSKSRELSFDRSH